jgi:hypothetical protein
LDIISNQISDKYNRTGTNQYSVTSYGTNQLNLKHRSSTNPSPQQISADLDQKTKYSKLNGSQGSSSGEDIEQMVEAIIPPLEPEKLENELCLKEEVLVSPDGDKYRITKNKKANEKKLAILMVHGASPKQFP